MVADAGRTRGFFSGNPFADFDHTPTPGVHGKFKILMGSFCYHYSGLYNFLLFV